MHLVGPNGAGNSTLLRCCAGIHDLAGDGVAARRCLGMAVDPAELPKLLTGREVLMLWARAHRLQAVPAALLELAEAWRFSPMLDRWVDQYSFGTRQKLGILLGLMDEPTVLLLDELLNGLDPRSALALKAELRRRAESGACVVLATHALEVPARFVNRALLLVDGSVRAEWNRSEIVAIREHPEWSLEASRPPRWRSRGAEGSVPRALARRCDGCDVLLGFRAQLAQMALDFDREVVADRGCADSRERSESSMEATHRCRSSGVQ